MFFYFQSYQVQVTAISECVYPRSPAMALGLTSALSLMIAQIIINVSTGCICCKRNPHPSNSNWTVALICFVDSWYVHSLLADKTFIPVWLIFALSFENLLLMRTISVWIKMVMIYKASILTWDTDAICIWIWYNMIILEILGY